MKKETVNKIHQTNLKRYGSLCPIKDPKVAAKRDATFKKNTKYCKLCGKPTNHPQKTVCEECKWSTCPVCNKRYYDANKAWRPKQFCSKECELQGKPARIQAALMSKYGVNTPLKFKDFKVKVQRTCQQCGQEFLGGGTQKFCKRCRTKTYVICGKQFVDSNYGWRPTQSCSSKYCQEEYRRLQVLKSLPQNFNTVSKLNRQWQQLLKEKFGVKFELEQVIGRYSYDLRYGNLLIDINPWISHNSTHSFAYMVKKSQKDHPVSSNYHVGRWKNAQEHGYTLLSYFDWYDEEKFLDIVRAKLNKCSNRVFARKTNLKLIEQKQANEFLETHHLQGKTTGQSVCLGLFYKDELVEIMTFGKPRMTKKWDWELIRLCTKCDWTIVGGKSKLLKYFLDNYEGTVFSYDNNDISCEPGELVKPMGIWFNPKTGRTINNNTVLRRGASRVVGDKDFTKYNKGEDNDTIMSKEGYYKIYNCGSTRQVIRDK